MSQAGFLPLGLHPSLCFTPKSQYCVQMTQIFPSFLLAGSRQFFLQGFADILRISP